MLKFLAAIGAYAIAGYPEGYSASFFGMYCVGLLVGIVISKN